MKKAIFLFVLAAGTILFISSCGKDDTVAPDINVAGGDETISLNSVYTDAGATANDDEDGTVTVTSDASSTNPNVNLKGVYTITYTATDNAGNTASASRTVTVVNDADFLGGQYIDATDSCALTPLSQFDATVTPSTTKNNEFTVKNFGAFGTGVNVELKWIPSTEKIVSAVSGNQSLGGTAALTDIYSASQVNSHSGPTLFYISYRWQDGAQSDNCVSVYTK